MEVEIPKGEELPRFLRVTVKTEANGTIKGGFEEMDETASKTAGKIKSARLGFMK